MNGKHPFSNAGGGRFPTLLGVLRLEACEYTLKLMEITENAGKSEKTTNRRGGSGGVLERAVASYKE
jgi:hypothetical protein